MAVVTLQELIELSKDIVSKYHGDDPQLWDMVAQRIDYIEQHGKLEEIDEDDDYSNDNLLYILSRKYCIGEQINETQPLFELWYRAS